jgi:RND family efflux transporter MFP subunit
MTKTKRIEWTPRRALSRWFALLAIIALAGLWPLASPHSQTVTGPGSTLSPPTVPVVLAHVEKRQFIDYTVGLGTVVGSSTVLIRPRVDGEIQQVMFAEGQDIKKGDILAQIDSSPLQAQLNQVIAQRARDEALLENAKLDLQRQEGLAKSGNTTKQALDTQKAQVAQYEAAIQSDEAQIQFARVQLGFTTIRSPIDGRAGIRLVDQGNVVHANESGGLVVITSIDPIDVIFTVPEDALDKIRHAMDGSQLEVLAFGRGDASPRSKGRLTLVDNQIDSTSGTVKLKARFDNKDRQLWPGQFVTIRLLLDKREDALTVPDTVIQRGQNGTFAYVVKDDLSVEMRPVTVAQIRDGIALITQGLQEGEQVVVDGQYKLKPGFRVSGIQASVDRAASDIKP